MQWSRAARLGPTIPAARTTARLPAEKRQTHFKSEIVDLYRKRGKDIFERSFWKGFGSLSGMVDEKYDADNLEKVLTDYLGQTRLSDVSQGLMVTGYDLHTRKPYFFKS